MTRLAATADAEVANPSGSRSRITRLVLLLLPAIIVAVGGWVHRWTDEDAFINFRIVDQIFAGNGPVFNVGERVETYTSAVWLGVLVAGRATLGWLMGPEWISVLLGLAAAVAGFAIAAFAGRSLHERGALVAPIGLVAVAAVPVVWDFATSGLEMGFVWLWIAVCFLALARVAGADSHAPHAPLTARARRWSLVVIGLGPLVRPDLGLMTVAFIVAWIVLARPRRMVHDLAVAFAIPVAYQVFRMGYFASLVPSTALAKDSGGLHVRQGWNYLRDLVGPYALWIPLTAVVAVVVVQAVQARDRRRSIAAGALVVAGLLHASYIIASGGDYMHGRLLLPALFAIAAPATVVLPARRPRGRAILAVVATAVVAVWSVVVIVGVRYPQPQPVTFGVADISDWRSILQGRMFHPADKGMGFVISAAQIHREFQAGWRGYQRVFDSKPRPGRDPRRLVVTMGSIGVPGWVVGPDVYVVDIGGLAEPLAARSAIIPGRAAGHRKLVSFRWYDARFGAARGGPRVQAARRALRCAPLSDLLDAIDRPLTPGRFLSNLWHAPEYTVLRIPRDPRRAEREFCSRQSGR